MITKPKRKRKKSKLSSFVFESPTDDKKDKNFQNNEHSIVNDSIHNSNKGDNETNDRDI